jgi:Protein of unknown function (DUF3617)
MRYNSFLVLIIATSLALLFSSLLLLGADFTPLNVKEGLWEVTVTHSVSGMPSAPSIPPDVLAKMPPEQRAHIEAMMKGGTTTDVHKDCITKEKLEKHSAFTNSGGECTRTVINSSGTKLEMKVHCEENQTSTDGTLVLEAVSPDNVKGTMHSVTNAKSRNMNIDLTFNSKYLGPSCGDVK